MKDPGEPPSLIHLSDRRPTPRELPAFAGEPPPAPAPPSPEQVALEPLRRFEIGQSLVLERLIALVLPELERARPPPLGDVCRTPGDLSEPELRALEARLGTYSRRVRRLPWLREPGYPLVMRTGESGLDVGRAGDSGVMPRRGLYLLPGGVLGYVEALGPWKKRGPGQSDRALTPTGARRVTAQDAVRLFPLHELVDGLRVLLWSEPEPGPDTRARRERFLRVVEELGRLVEDANTRLWRLGLDRD